MTVFEKKGGHVTRFRRGRAQHIFAPWQLRKTALLIALNQKFLPSKRYAGKPKAGFFTGDTLKTYRTSGCMLLVAILAAGCGGGADGQGTCSLGGSAGCGGSIIPPGPPDGSAPPADPSAAVSAVGVVTSSGDLPSSGLPGTEVTVTALVKSAANVGVAGAKVQFSADSGFLSVESATTDAGGKASARLYTGGSPANRAIKVTVRSGAQAGSATVNVSGTHLAFNAPASLAVGDSASLVATLLDSSDRPIPGANVTASARNGNGITLGATKTDASGQVPLQLKGSALGTEEFTVGALGTTVTRSVVVSGGAVVFRPAVTTDASGAQVMKEVTIGSCTPVNGTSSTASSSITLATSRGGLYADAACTRPVSGALAYSGGTLPNVWLKADDAGIATVEGVLAGGGRGSTQIEFTAPLRPTARVDLQANQAIVGAGERSTLVAVVRDGTAANNVVKGATVAFSIVSDLSGGTLLSPLSVVTGSDGVARAVFQAGPNAGDTAATVIQAKVLELPTVTSSTSLTVNKKALSIQFGTGNKLIPLNTAVLQQEFAVFVADNAGNPVKDVAISASAWAVNYSKGSFEQVPPDAPATGVQWAHHLVKTCPNEDIHRRGIFDPALDTNKNQILDPGVPLTVTVSGKTDALGLATVWLRYPADRAYWNDVELQVSGTVAGTETTPSARIFTLAGIASDYANRDQPPPGLISPYGVAASCSVAN
jgi:hypothetical protein